MPVTLGAERWSETDEIADYFRHSVASSSLPIIFLSCQDTHTLLVSIIIPLQLNWKIICRVLLIAEQGLVSRVNVLYDVIMCARYSLSRINLFKCGLFRENRLAKHLLSQRKLKRACLRDEEPSVNPRQLKKCKTPEELLVHPEGHGLLLMVQHNVRMVICYAIHAGEIKMMIQMTCFLN